jgi:hypothetical protein
MASSSLFWGANNYSLYAYISLHLIFTDVNTNLSFLSNLLFSVQMQENLNIKLFIFHPPKRIGLINVCVLEILYYKCVHMHIMYMYLCTLECSVFNSLIMQTLRLLKNFIQKHFSIGHFSFFELFCTQLQSP